jgi:hypothetical protein
VVSLAVVCGCSSSAHAEQELYSVEYAKRRYVVILMLCLLVLQVWCVVLLCFILGMPMLHSYVAFAAITSIGVIGLYISYLGAQLG